jgi:hypothetical protein
VAGPVQHPVVHSYPWRNGYAVADRVGSSKPVGTMLLSDCRPGVRVTYFRPWTFSFDAIIVRTTPRGNVLLCANRRNGLRISPLFLSVPPGRIDIAPTATEGVEQTAHRL